MNRFHARNRSEAVLVAEPETVWSILTNPDLLVQFTPNLKRIDVAGDVWTWHLTRIPVLSSAIEPTFTELMTFDKPRQIAFSHDDSRVDERTGVDGSYRLTPEGRRTRVSIDIAIWVDLPLPRIARLGVEGTMATVVSAMGLRFGQRMRRHLARGGTR